MAVAAVTNASRLQVISRQGRRITKAAPAWGHGCDSAEAPAAAEACAKRRTASAAPFSGAVCRRGSRKGESV